MDKKRQVIIVGGGASGLTAGIMAARNGAAVTILEQNEKPGRKICVTGNGRCNLTNQDMSWKYFHGEHPEFAKKILAQFSLEDTLRFFDELGIVVTEKKGWLYPRDVYKRQDKYRRSRTDGKKWLAELEAREKERTGIKSLKIKYSRVFGYSLEVTNSFKDQVPDNYVRKQTLTNAERYITQELKELEDLILGAEDRLYALELSLIHI